MADQNLTTGTEIWKPIPGYPGYEVSDQGRVRSFWRSAGKGKGQRIVNAPQRIIKAKFDNGYLRVGLRQNGKKSMFFVHRLVLLVFKGPCPPGKESCHGDGVRTNDYIKNLRWGSRLENVADKVIHGTNPMGESHPIAKLSEDQVRQIRSLYSNGYLQREIAAMFGIGQTAVGRIVNRKSWSHCIIL